MTQKEVGTFEKLLFADTFRGPHSTGVFARRTMWMDAEEHVSIPLYKKAVEGPEFLETQGWADTSRGFKDVAKFPNFIVGHNRYATVGTINDENAHPFKHGDITLVHNGTLLDQTLLPDHRQFDVDSENVCHSINKIGASETIQNLDGAFVLIWHDAKDDTLHIIRNDERPFHLAKTQSGDWFGASEEAMLMWILKRPRIPYTVTEHFECKVGVEYVFDVSNGFRLKEEIEHELPDFYSDHFSRLYGTGSYNGYGMGWQNQISHSRGASNSSPAIPHQKKATVDHIDSKKSQKVNNVLKKEGVTEKLGDKLTFTSYDFHMYTSKNNCTTGRVMGYIDHMTIYIEVQMHNVEAVNFEKHQDMTGIIVGAYEMGGVTTVVLRELKDDEKKPVEQASIDNVLEFGQYLRDQDDASDDTILANGSYYTKKSWETSGNCQCGNCSEQIPFNQLGDVTWYEATPVCVECDDIVSFILEGNAIPPGLTEGEFECGNCGIYHSKKNESTVSQVCKECLEWADSEGNEYKQNDY